MPGRFAKALVAMGTSVSVGFGLWHFFVPTLWNWCSYIDPSATELVIAIRAINIFFSLSLVLFGLSTAMLVLGGRANRYTVAVALSATSSLWLTRVVLQLVTPQGSMSPLLQYSMLAAFVTAFLCHAVPLALALSNGRNAGIDPRLPPHSAPGRGTGLARDSGFEARDSDAAHGGSSASQVD